MNRRATNQRNILRHRRRGTIPTLRLSTPTGGQVKVQRSPFRPDRATYDTRYALVYGEWPPSQKTWREVQRWV